MDFRPAQQEVVWPAQEDPAWTIVRRWAGMRGEDKLAWAFLWGRSRGGLERITTSPSEVAADQGVTADAGRARLKNLAASGLLHVLNRERSTGVWLVEVFDPADLQRRVLKSDGQRLLFEDEPQGTLCSEAEAGVPTAGGWSLGLVGGDSVHGGTEEPPELPRSGTEDPPEVPRSPVFGGLSNPRARLKSSVFVRSSSSESSRGVRGDGERRGSSGASSAVVEADADAETAAAIRLIELRREQVAPRAPAAERPLCDSLRGRAAAERLPRFGDLHANQVQDVERLAAEILQRVGDASLRKSPVLRVAWAVVEGRLPRERLYRLLDRLDVLRSGGNLACPASAYFVSAAKGTFRDLDLDWSGKGI